MATRVALKLIRQSVFNVRRKPNFIPRHHYCANAGPPPPPPPPKIPHSSRKASINNMLHTFYCALFFINYMSNFWVMLEKLWSFGFSVSWVFFFQVGDICDCSFNFAGYKAPFFSPLNNGFMGWNFNFVHVILAVMIVKIGGGSKLGFFMS